MVNRTGVGISLSFAAQAIPNAGVGTFQHHWPLRQLAFLLSEIVPSLKVRKTIVASRDTASLTGSQAHPEDASISLLRRKRRV